MRKAILFGFISSILLFGCKDKSSENHEVINNINKIDHKVTVDRFDMEFFETPQNNFNTVVSKYPFFFPVGVDMNDLMYKRTDSIWLEVFQDVKRTFPDNEKFADIEFLFKSVKYHFPDQKVPTKLITLIGDMEKDYSAIYTDTLAILSLETYLGDEHVYYTDFPKYLRPLYNQDQMVQDMAQKFASKVISRSSDNTLIANMVQSGKVLFLKDNLLPQTTDEAKIVFTPEQLLWCAENESEIWSYFIENKLLYESDAKLDARFINPAPFSKFYLEIDAESPGRVGVWIGWQIVKSYMKNNNVDLATMLKTEPKEIFEKSKYKPSK